MLKASDADDLLLNNQVKIELIQHRIVFYENNYTCESDGSLSFTLNSIDLESIQTEPSQINLKVFAFFKYCLIILK